MKKILNFLTGNVLSEIGKVIDNIFTNDEERQQAKNELVKIIQQKELELQKMQTDIIIAEAKGNCCKGRGDQYLCWHLVL